MGLPRTPAAKRTARYAFKEFPIQCFGKIFFLDDAVYTPAFPFSVEPLLIQASIFSTAELAGSQL
jgi:hypothetical protein